MIKMKVDTDRIDRPDKCDRCGEEIGGVGRLDGKEVMINGEPKMLCENCLETAYKYQEVDEARV